MKLRFFCELFTFYF